MNTNNYKVFIRNILQNSDHTLSSLSEILDISKRKLKYLNQLSQSDFKKIDELKEILAQTHCPWLS